MGANSIVAEYLMGHCIDPLFYDKACNDHDWLKEEYSKFCKAYNILTDLEPYGLITQKQAKKMLSQNDERVEALERIVEELTLTIKILTANMAQANLVLEKEGIPLATGADPEEPLELKEGEELTKEQIKKITPLKVNQPRSYTAEEVRKLMEYMAKKGVVNPHEISEMLQTVSETSE
jgi:polyhydroxyalkanoate synthesis regulator phasin